MLQGSSGVGASVYPQPGLVLWSRVCAPVRREVARLCPWGSSGVGSVEVRGVNSGSEEYSSGSAMNSGSEAERCALGSRGDEVRAALGSGDEVRWDR